MIIKAISITNDFVRRLPGVHAPSGMNAKNRTHDRRLVSCEIEPKLLKRSVSFDTIRVTRRDRDG